MPFAVCSLQFRVLCCPHTTTTLLATYHARPRARKAAIQSRTGRAGVYFFFCRPTSVHLRSLSLSPPMLSFLSFPHPNQAWKTYMKNTSGGMCIFLGTTKPGRGRVH
ncbi:hypothetical protein F4677DRAFT_119546 [Hypoxylon crocopeplum]|nr:hypothetical protein F4677DRAFT_119546 [Hypoxylon crocopeplum]